MSERERHETMWYCPKCTIWVGSKLPTCSEEHSPPRRPLRAADVDKKPAWEVTLKDRLRAKLKPVGMLPDEYREADSAGESE